LAALTVTPKSREISSSSMHLPAFTPKGERSRLSAQLMIATSIASLRPDNMNKGPAPAADGRSEKWTFE
jgi:hypothetical protein